MTDVADNVHDKDAEIEENETSEADAGEEVDSDEYDDNEYCICRGRDDGTFMIQCDRCTEWYHGKCIQVTRRKVKEVERWVCPFCEAKLKAGITPTVVTRQPKKRREQSEQRDQPRTEKQQDQTKTSQPRTRGDDDNPRKRKREENGAEQHEHKRAKSEVKSDVSGEVKGESKENALKTSREGRGALKKSDKSRGSAPSPPPLRHSAGTSEAQWQQQREGVRTKLVAMLQRVSSDGSEATLQEIAREIEDTLAEHVPRAQYLSKFRALMLSLPKNSELCAAVLSGAVSGSALVRMDEEQWAPKALQDLRAKYQHYLPVKPNEDEALAAAHNAAPLPGTVPPADAPSDQGEDRSESAVHEEVSRDAVSRDSPRASEHKEHVTEQREHVTEQQTPPGSPYQAMEDESDSEHVTGPSVALEDIDIDVKVDEKSLEPIEFTEPIPEPEPEPTPVPAPQSADMYDPDASLNDDSEPVVPDEDHVVVSEYIDQIWQGLLTYQKLIPDVALRSVHLEGAKVEHLMSEELVIDGRMDLRQLLDYLPQIDLSQSRQRTTLLFKPALGYEEYYQRMYEHLRGIHRGGVIRVDQGTDVFKEIYLVPVLRHSPPTFIAPALKALGDSPTHRHLIGQSEELLLGVFLTRRADLAALPARTPRTPKHGSNPEVHVPPPQSQPAPKPHPAPELPKSVPNVRIPAVQTPNIAPGMPLPPNPNLPNPNLPNPTTFLPPQLQSLLSNLIGQALGPAPVQTPQFTPNPAPYVPHQNRGYPPQSYSAQPPPQYNNSAPGQYDEYHDPYRNDYNTGGDYQQHDNNNNEYHNNNDYNNEYNNDYNNNEYHNNNEYNNEYRGYNNNRYHQGSNYNNNRYRGQHHNNNNGSNNRRGGGFRPGGGGRFRSNNPRGRRF